MSAPYRTKLEQELYDRFDRLQKLRLDARLDITLDPLGACFVATAMAHYAVTAALNDNAGIELECIRIMELILPWLDSLDPGIATLMQLECSELLMEARKPKYHA